MFQVILGLQELQLSEDRAINKRVKCKGASAMGTPMLGQLMSQDDKGRKTSQNWQYLGKIKNFPGGL